MKTVFCSRLKGLLKAAFIFFVILSNPALLRAAWELASNQALPAPPGLEFSLREARGDEGTVKIWRVAFDPKKLTFAVMDNPAGDYDLGLAAQKRGALSAVNGGYFHPDRTPLGLVVRQGVQLHALERAKLLSGVVSTTNRGVAVQRVEAFKLSTDLREALQAGPFLVEGGKPINGLNATRSAARTVVFQDAPGRVGFLICKNATLAGMASLLATAAVFPEGRILRALNLDGGSSTALWVRGEPVFYQREWKSVRNYLAIVPR